jgi:internalin A
MEEPRTMRLSQVARLLNVGVPTVVSHLTAKGFKVDNNPNNKLNAEQLDFLAKDFKNDALLTGHSGNKSTITGIEVISKNDTDIPTWFRATKTEVQTRIDFARNKKLTGLDLSGLELTEIPKEIAGLTALEKLDLSSNQITKIQNLDSLVNLRFLNLNSNQIPEIEDLDNLEQLRFLYLKGNSIPRLSNLKNLYNLVDLDVSQNGIIEINGLNTLIKLESLRLSDNLIAKTENISQLTNLKALDLSNNSIHILKGLRSLKNLEYLRIDRNPLEQKYGIELEHGQNHLPLVKNILDRLTEVRELKKKGAADVYNFYLPAKIVLLGNHAVGKSSLLHYLQYNNLDYAGDSTHLLQIINYEIESEPKPLLAKFFDFGGQDYYHGIYRAFLSSGAGYLLVWDKDNNTNTIKPDSKNNLTQNFSLHYWLGQKAYLENEKYNSNSDPVLLIQTHAQQSERPVFFDMSDNDAIVNTFYVSLHSDYNPPKNQKALEYLKTEIEAIIEEKMIEREEPKWYHEFVQSIEEKKELSDEKAVDIAVFDSYKPKIYATDNEGRLASLRVELEQFHQQGLVLYYPDINENKVWLNPEQVVRYAHDNILSKKILESGKGFFPVENLSDYEPDLIALLEKQQVIFKHEYGNNGSTEYIVPNYLPLAEANQAEYDLFTFGLAKPTFILKFQMFLPIGLINQLICFYGRQPDNKKFWRNQLLFTLERKCKVLIKLDFENLEIRVHISLVHSEQENDNFKKYLFYSLMALYWDMDEILTYSEFIAGAWQTENADSKSSKFENCRRIYERKECWPQDLYVSVDGSYFVNYERLCEHDKGNSRILAYYRNDEGQDTSEPRLIPVFPFQIFTNKKLIKMKKIFISYSKDDLQMVNKFIEHLSALQLDGSTLVLYRTIGRWRMAYGHSRSL